MAVLTEINKRFDAASLAALLEKFKETYGSVQDIKTAIESTDFTDPEEKTLETTHAIKFIGEDGLNTILQLIKDVKDNAGTSNVSDEQLESINSGISTLNDVVEAINEDVNDLAESSEVLQTTVGAHTDAITNLETAVGNILGETNDAQYILTSDTELVDGKTYYTKEGDVYTVVETPSVDNIASYYEESIPAETREYNSLIEAERAIEDLEEQVENNVTGLTGIVNTATGADFTDPAGETLETTHAIKFIGEDGLNTILQLMKDMKEDYESRFNAMNAQLNAMDEGLRTLNDMIEIMNEGN